jgi:hypothetical protein
MLWQWSEQLDFCYRCCTTWGETVIRVQCDKSYKNVTDTEKTEKKQMVKDVEREKKQGNTTIVEATKEREKEVKIAVGEEKEPQRELGFS